MYFPVLYFSIQSKISYLMNLLAATEERRKRKKSKRRKGKWTCYIQLLLIISLNFISNLYCISKLCGSCWVGL